MKSQRKATLTVIEEIDLREAGGGLTDQDLLRREQARAKVLRVANMEETSVRQKSRCLWLKERDRNTKFFHRMANAHKRGNQIGTITIDGV